MVLFCSPPCKGGEERHSTLTRLPVSASLLSRQVQPAGVPLRAVTEARAIEAGASDYIPKPVDVDRLLSLGAIFAGFLFHGIFVEPEEGAAFLQKAKYHKRSLNMPERSRRAIPGSASIHPSTRCTSVPG